MSINFQQSREFLQEFQFNDLFVYQLGWNNPESQRPIEMAIEGEVYYRAKVAELSGVAVLKLAHNRGRFRRLRLEKQFIKKFRSWFERIY